MLGGLPASPGGGVRGDFWGGSPRGTPLGKGPQGPGGGGVPADHSQLWSDWFHENKDTLKVKDARDEYIAFFGENGEKDPLQNLEEKITKI